MNTNEETIFFSSFYPKSSNAHKEERAQKNNKVLW
jgi:hypothetical protein